MVDIDKALCMSLKGAISDERKAPPMYRILKEMLSDAGILTTSDEARINRIIQDEEEHEKFFEKLAKEKGCILSTVEERRKLYSDLPLVERIKLARGFVSKSEKMR